MTTRDSLLKLLWENADSYISGTAAAKALGVSRTAVWKAIDQLKADGYLIESVTNRGYRLSSKSDVLSLGGVEKYLDPDIKAEVRREVSSTNTVLKELAENGAPAGSLLIAGAQTRGKGRMGRSFWSPADSGVYMSLLLRPAVPAAETLGITAAAAVAAAEGIEELSGRKTGIKWVNDVLCDGKKVAGILTEASVNCETGMMNYVIVGIGINTCQPEGDFPEDIREVAGAVFPDYGRVPELRCRLAAAVMNRLYGYAGNPNAEELHKAYVARSTVLGERINILSCGEIIGTGTVEGIDREYALLVRTPGGELRRINTGEVSIRKA